MDYLYETMADNATEPKTHIISGQGEMETTKFGAKRESNEGRGRFDLLPYEAIEALAKWYEAGAQKYAERNWEQGISVKDCINRMIRHSLKAGNGWTDEDHLAAVMWNAAAAITMMQRRPDCNNHIWKPQEDNTECVTKVEPDSNIKTKIGKLSRDCIGCIYHKGFTDYNEPTCSSYAPCKRDENGYLTGYVVRIE